MQGRSHHEPVGTNYCKSTARSMRPFSHISRDTGVSVIHESGFMRALFDYLLKRMLLTLRHIDDNSFMRQTNASITAHCFGTYNHWDTWIANGAALFMGNSIWNLGPEITTTSRIA